MAYVARYCDHGIGTPCLFEKWKTDERTQVYHTTRYLKDL